MKCFWPARKRPRADSPPAAPTVPAGGDLFHADHQEASTVSRPRPAQVPRLNLTRLNTPLSQRSSRETGLQTPIAVTVDGAACASERTLGRVLSAYHAHQAQKDIAEQVDAVSRRHGWVSLVVGGERAPAEYRSPRGLFAAETYGHVAAMRAASAGRACELTLNSDATALPHLWGDVSSGATMMRFADNSIDAVHFEFVPFTAFTCWGDRSLADMYEHHQRDLAEAGVPWLWSATSPTEYRGPRIGADAFTHLARVMRPGAMLDLTSGFPPETPRCTMMRALADAGFVVQYLETPLSPRRMVAWLGTRARSLKVRQVARRATPGMVLRAVWAPTKPDA